MTNFPVPQSSGTIPPPASILFPASPLAADPSYGANPYGPNLYTPGTFGIDYSLGIPDLQTRAAQQQQMMQMAQLSSLGLAPDTDPHVWTPEEAARQTDQAIAKIATVNPDAAEALAQQRAPQEDSGDSFWDNLKEVAGNILAPGLELGGRILDIVGRTANIVPNLAFDVVNGGDFDFAEDIGGALSGKTRHNWNSVFQEIGLDGDGIGGFIRATVGLGLDIATDPLTWLIPAGAAAKASDAAAMTAKTAATRSTTLLERAKTLYGIEGDALVTRMESAYEHLTKGAGAKIFKKADDGADIISGLVAESVEVGQRELMSDMLKIADETYRAVRTRSLATWVKSGGTITLADGSKLAGKELVNVVEQTIKAGNMSGAGLQLFSTGQWKTARQLASSLGGVRLKVNLPFTNLRYISKGLPYSKLATEKTVGFVTRALAGQGGMNRMLSAIGKGEGEMSDLVNWMENGFNSAFDKNPDMVRNLRGKYKNMGSMYYSMSEAMGSITGHFDTGARATRAGLAGYLAHGASIEAKSLYTKVVREIAYESTGVSGVKRDRQGFLRAVEGTLGVSFRKKGMKATDDQMRDMARFLDWFPSELDVNDPAALDNWFWAKPENADLRLRAAGEEGVGAAELEKAEAKLAQMHEVVDRLEPAQRELLRDTQEMWHTVRGEMAKRDAVLADIRHNYERAGILVTKQAEEWQLGAHPLLQQDFYIDAVDAGRHNRLNYNGVAEADVADHDGILGVRATRTSGGGRGVGGSRMQVRARARGGNWVIVDETADATMSDAATIEALRSGKGGADEAAQESRAAIEAAAEGVQFEAVTAKEQARTSAAMTTEALRRTHPDATGVMYRRANGDVELVVFDPSDIKVVSDNAAHLVPSERGYLRRTFNKKAKEWLRGRIPKAERQILIEESEVPGYLARATLGMDLDEADDYVRTWLADVYGAEGLPDTIWNTNILEVHEEYLEHAGEAVASEMLGSASKRIVALGDVQPAMFGSNPRSAKYQWMLHPSIQATLARKDAKLTQAVLRMHELDAKRMEESHARLTAVADEYGMYQAMVAEALASGGEVPSRFVQAVRKHGATVADADKAIGSELDGIRSAEHTLHEHGLSYDEAFDALKDDPAYGHPQAGDPVSRVTLPDGRERIRGWFGGLQGPDTIDWPDDPTELSNNGFHFGTKDQAAARVKTWIESTDTEATLGYRGRPETWPTEQVVSGGLPDESKFASWDAYVEASEKAGKPVVYTDVPIEPSHYYDDYLWPVEVEGNFVDSTEADIGTFSGSSRGSTPEKVADREALGDKDGYVYQNDPANGHPAGPEGQSVVVKDPHSVVVSNAYMNFDEDVRLGRLYRQADGTVSARRTAGSKKLIPRQDVTEQLDALYERKSELEGLRRQLRKGAPADEVAPRPLADNVVPEAVPAAPPRPKPHQVEAFELDGDTWRFTVGDKGKVDVKLTPEGDFKIYSTFVDPGSRRQGMAEAMYVKAAELAEEYGGRLVSDNPGSRTPEAERLWASLKKKGYNVVDEDVDGGVVHVLYADSYPTNTAARNEAAQDAIDRLHAPVTLSIGDGLGEVAEVTARRATGESDDDLVTRVAIDHMLKQDILDDAQRGAIVSETDYSMLVDSLGERGRPRAARNADELDQREYLLKTAQQHGYDTVAEWEHAMQGRIDALPDGQAKDVLQSYKDDPSLAWDAVNNGGHGEDAAVELFLDEQERMFGEATAEAERRMGDALTERIGPEAVKERNALNLLRGVASEGPSDPDFGLRSHVEDILGAEDASDLFRVAEGTQQDIQRALMSMADGPAARQLKGLQDDLERLASRAGQVSDDEAQGLLDQAAEVVQQMDDLVQERLDAFEEMGQQALGLPNAEVITRVPDVAEEAAKRPRASSLDVALRGNAKAGESVARTATAAAKALGRNERAAGKRLERLRRQTQLAMTEANKAYAEFHGAVAQVKPSFVKMETAGQMTGMTRLRVPGLEGYAMPDYIAAEFHAAIDQYGAQGLQKAWRTYVMGPWKRWATYRWPGFHVRNFFGAFFNNWLGGVGLEDYVFSWRVNHARDGALKWVNKEVDADTIKRLRLDLHFGKDYTPTYNDIANLMGDQAVGRANTLAVMGIESSSQASHEVYHVVGHKNPNAMRRAARRFDNTMRDTGSSVEDFHRVAAWATGMSATAGDTYGARAFVMMRHGDYSDLTHAEEYIKDVIPFYKWMRTNVPYQLRMLAENPAKLTLVHDKLKRYAFEAQGIDYEEAKLQMPDYMQESLAIPIPSWVPVVGSKDKDALKFAMFDLPYADLYNGLDEYMSSALPIGRNILESYGFHQTLFSGTPLAGNYKPLSGVFNVPGIRDILHAAKLTKRGPDGQEYMEDRLQNVLMAWPIFSRFRNFTESDPARVDSRVGGLFSMMAGVGIKQGDYTNAELDFYYNEVQPLLDQYRSLGIQLPTVDDFQSGEVGSQVGLTAPSEQVTSPLQAQVA